MNYWSLIFALIGAFLVGAGLYGIWMAAGMHRKEHALPRPQPHHRNSVLFPTGQLDNYWMPGWSEWEKPSVWVECGPLDIHIGVSDEGVFVDIWPLSNGRPPLASAHATFQDGLGELLGNIEWADEGDWSDALAVLIRLYGSDAEILRLCNEELVFNEKTYRFEGQPSDTLRNLVRDYYAKFEPQHVENPFGWPRY